LRQQNASHRQLDDTAAALQPKDNQQLPIDLPKRASYPPTYLQQANAPATKRG
jgi:hypothetical protein